MKRRLIVGFGLAVVALVMIGVIRHQPAEAPTARAEQGSYIALGDSVAAGVGLATPSDSSACDRTNEAYPNAVAQRKQYRLSSLACSGATLPSGILGPQDVNRLTTEAQLQQAFRQDRPTVLTMTVGANDAGWTGFIASCYRNVCGSAADTATVNNRLSDVTANLRNAFTQIRQHYGSSVPRVVLVGYYQVFPETAPADCLDLAAIDSNELAWGRQMQTSINQALATAASDFDFVTTATPDFAGHELCTSVSWVQGLNDPQPYHPTAEGQKRIAESVLKALQ